MAKKEIPAQVILVCDRCKREAEEAQGIFKDGIHVIESSFRQPEEVDNHIYELCNSCSKMFDRFINMTPRKKKENKALNEAVEKVENA